MIFLNLIQVIFSALWTVFIVYIISPFLNYKAAFWITIHVWTPVITFLILSKIETKGLENIDSNKHYIFMANHSSYFDIVCLFNATKRNLHFIAKEELSRQFFTGYMLRKLKIIFIDRSNAQNSARSMKQAIEVIKNGKNVAIFPEGTRTKTGNLGAFRRGGFKLAIQAQTEIIPVAISKSAKAWPRNNFSFRPTTVTLTFGKPISIQGYSENDTKEIQDKVVNFIASNITH